MNLTATKTQNDAMRAFLQRCIFQAHEAAAKAAQSNLPDHALVWVQRSGAIPGDAHQTTLGVIRRYLTAIDWK